MRLRGLSRVHALEFAGEDRARKIPYESFEKAMQEGSKREMDLLLFVEAKGIHQIHGGKVKRIVDTDGWFNVLDPDFNLHVNRSKVDHVWHVRKPTANGVVNSIELYEESGDTLAMLFSKKARDESESSEWREVVYGATGYSEASAEVVS